MTRVLLWVVEFKLTTFDSRWVTRWRVLAYGANQFMDGCTV